MPETDENRKIQKITKLLEMGGTMLANHHECGAPLFRYQGKVVCPVCDFQEKQEEKQKEKQKERPELIKRAVEQKEARPEIKPEMINTERSQAVEYHQIATLTRNKTYSIAASLENETDLQRIKEKMECIELGIRILKLIE